MVHTMMLDTVAQARNKESTFEQPTQCCPNPSCTGAAWHVEQVSAANQLWRVSSTTGGSYLIAGVTPACPWCGSDLAVTANLGAMPSTNGLLQPVGESSQPKRNEHKPQWN
jgi:hypothetical protein